MTPSTTRSDPEVPVDSVEAAAYEIPTDRPESDATLAWESTTLTVVEIRAGGKKGLGYTYSHAAAASVIDSPLADVLEGRNALAVRANWRAMQRAVRNIGRPGLIASAISALDVALWDLKARLFGLPIVELLGRAREAVSVYGSGGFTSYGDNRLREQLAGWADAGMGAVKMKVGRHPDTDPRRVEAAREAVGDQLDLMVDANGAWPVKQALAFAERVSGLGVVWFEEPVTSDDLRALRAVSRRLPAGMEVAGGEYGYTPTYFRRMLEAGAVDCLQADASRALGYTGFLEAAALCDARAIDLSGHAAPALHLHVCCAAPSFRHLEYFHDHVRIERQFFDGVIGTEDGKMQPDLSRPGHGLSLKTDDLEEFRIA